MSAIEAAFARCREEKRAAFIPFLVAGHPTLEQTGDLLDALAAGGADVIELGVPFSDPIADGPVIQRASTAALEGGATLAATLDLIARKRASLDVPIVLFTYFNPILARGLESFAEQAAESGVDGVLCVDLPPEEGQLELAPHLARRGVDMVYLLAPTSTKERVRQVAESSAGFVYYVSRNGVTGEREALAPELAKEVKRLARRLELPVAVGFGISSPEQVAEVARVADGVVVGSALVRLVEEHAERPDVAALVEAEVRRLVEPLAEAKRRWRFGR